MEHAYYINLEHRTDRKEFLEKQLNMYDISFTRINAISNKNGLIGCALSHIKTLREIYNSDVSYGIVLEDDFFLLDHNHFRNFLNDFKIIQDSGSWDVIVLTPRGTTITGTEDMISKNFYRINNNQTTTGYIVKKNTIPVIIDSFKESVNGLIKGLDPNEYALDQIWKKVQNKHNFYYYRDVFAGQLPGYSDIEKRPVDYNDRFINQHKY